MPITTDRGRLSAPLAWFGALWASGVLGLGAVASLLHCVLSHLAAAP